MALDVSIAPAMRTTRWLPYIGPAVAVSIGYIDPGNWASDLGASVFGCSLLWVIVLANAVAIVVQIAVTRVTLSYGAEIGSLISTRWPRARIAFWAVFQFGAIATDVAEFAGIVLGIQLLFGVSAPLAAAAGLAIVFALLGILTRKAMRSLDIALAAVLVGVAVMFVKLAFGGHAAPADVLRGTFVPTIPGPAALLVIVAIVGATVMPHNLFLHSALVRNRVEHEPPSVRESLRSVFAIETAVTLNVATIVNIAIVIVGVSLLGGGATIQTAFATMHHSGTVDQSWLFGIGLLVSGIAATITSTLAGDYIYRSFGVVPVPAFVRRAVTVLPAAAILGCGVDATELLLFSQIALCLTLPIVLFPLIALLASARRGAERGDRSFLILTKCAVAVCVALDLVFLITTVT